MKTLITLIDGGGAGVYVVADGDFSNCHDMVLSASDCTESKALNELLECKPALSPEEAFAELGSVFKLAIVYL